MTGRDWQASDAKLMRCGGLDSYLDCNPYDIWARDDIGRVCGLQACQMGLAHTKQLADGC